MTYYETLGVPPDAEDDEIRAAYRALAHRLHPDRGGDAAAFARLAEAWEVLRDPQKRLLYNIELRVRRAVPPAPPFPSGPRRPLRPVFEQMIDRIAQHALREVDATLVDLFGGLTDPDRAPPRPPPRARGTGRRR